MGSRVCLLTSFLIAFHIAGADAEPEGFEDSVLKNQLNSLQSRSVQRQGREQRIQDLLKRQDDRIARQALNELKTRDIRNEALPRLQRQLERSRSP